MLFLPSRAHTIVGINFTQKSPNAEGQSMTKTSVINLVDLAGRFGLIIISAQSLHQSCRITIHS